MEDPLLALRLHDGSNDEPAQILAALRGDPGAQAWLVDRWTAPVYRFCRRMLGNDEDARDASQDTLVKVLRNLSKFDIKRKFSTWVFQIARNTCIDEYRKRKRRSWEEPPDVADPGPTPLMEVDASRRADRVVSAIDQLPPMYREVLVMYHFEQLKYVEIAEVLDLPLGTVMNRIFRARKKLRGLYEDMGGEP